VKKREGRAAARASRQADEPREPSVPALTAGLVALAQMNLFITLIAAFILGAAGIFLTTAWIYGPGLLLERHQYRRFTAKTDARIVDSWLALELAQSDIRNPRFWRASAKASPCFVLETVDSGATTEWNAPARRGFCGMPRKFDTGYTLADIREFAPGVPFAWSRDEHGFAVPELRMDAATRAWLAAHPAHTFMHSDWPATNELEWLTLELDRPVDHAVAGWSAAAPTVPLMLDPAHPEEPLPAGTIKSRLATRPNWLAVGVIGVMGLALWWLGFSLIPQLEGIPPVFRWFVMVLPLLTLPTWIDTFPKFLEPLSAKWTMVISDMLGDLNPIDRVRASEPSQTTLVNGVRLRWFATAGAYASTFGRVAPARPPEGNLDPNAALFALSNGIAQRMRIMSPDERAEVFTTLKADKRRDLKAAGIVFLASARERLNDPADGSDGRAARGFLEEWFVSPVEPVDSHDLAFGARRTLVAALKDAPIADVARSASDFVSRIP